MKNKIFFIIGMLISFFITINIINETYAVYGGVCSTCGGSITLTYYYYNTSTHTVSKACGCVTGAQASPESHKYPDSWEYDDDTWHKRACICGAIQRRAHSGGTATCTEAAKCDDCGSSYGEALGHNYGNYVPTGTSKHHKVCAKCNATSTAENCIMNSEIITEASCTVSGVKRYTCSVCSRSYDEEIPKIEHSWSTWKQSQTEHWKVCSYGCGTETSRGAHVDNNPQNGRCDSCNYEMYIIPEGNVSGTTEVKEGNSAEFFVNISKGTQPISYQWYYKTSASSAETLITGANKSSLSFITTKEMDGRRYFCKLSNLGGSYTTNEVILTVYYEFSLNHPQNVNLKNGQTATFTVGIASHGNPNSYSYQWYVSNSENGGGSKLNGATQSSYSVKPTKNVSAEYYYCIVSNGVYEKTSNKAKLVADITGPEINKGSFNENVTINKSLSLEIPIVVTDAGEGYTVSNNFKAEEITVLVGGVATTCTKTLEHKNSTGNTHNYVLKLSNINGNGTLSFVVVEDAVKDNFGNTNEEKKITTSVIIDNKAPDIRFESVSGDLNENYANKDDTLNIIVSVVEAEEFEPSVFTIEDIEIKVGNSIANTDIKKEFKYVSQKANIYNYKLTLSNIKGDGPLSLNIPKNKINDIATNTNLDTTLPVTIENITVIIDNTSPEIEEFITSLGSYNNTSNLYPNNIESRRNGWAKENVYVQLNAKDNQKIDYYMKSVGDNTDYNIVTSESSNINIYQEVIKESINKVIYYRVYDKAGNYDEESRTIKIDKYIPNKPIISLFEQRINGAEYIFNPNKPTDKAIYVIPDASTLIDRGTVQSGIDKEEALSAYTYYTVTMYKDIDSTGTKLWEKTKNWNEGLPLNETGYYEIVMKMTDIAGNEIISDVYKVYINRKVENTIRVYNINDIGSGTQKVTIKIFETNASGNKTSVEAIDPIVVNNPYKEVIKNVRLGKGTFVVEITLEDGVGNTTVLTGKIKNKLQEIES